MGYEPLEMPTLRSQVPGGLPPLGHSGTGTSNTRRSEAALAREARAAERRQAKARAAKARAAAERRRQVEEEEEADEDASEAFQDFNPNVGDVGSEEPDPCDQNPPHKVWMGIQACGVCNEKVAKSLAENLFMSNFSG